MKRKKNSMMETKVESQGFLENNDENQDFICLIVYLLKLKLLSL